MNVRTLKSLSSNAALFNPRLLFALRLFFVLLLGASAVTKLLDMPGFYAIVRNYRAVPEAFILFAAWGLTLAELALAFWLVRGRFLREAALAVCAIHVFYFLWLLITLLRGLRLENCGCFGVYFARPLTWFTPAEDVLLLGMAIWLWLGYSETKTA